MDILNIDLNCINLDEDDSNTIIHVQLLAWRTKFEKLKTLLKELNEELMSVLCHPNRCEIGACQKMRKKKQIQCLL